jgi:hypothetical protein
MNMNTPVTTNAQHVVSGAPAPAVAGCVRTFFVFLDQPKLVEYRVADMPLIDIGTVVEFSLTLHNLRCSKNTVMNGPYRVKRRILRYSSNRCGRQGLAQYLEWEPYKL